MEAYKPINYNSLSPYLIVDEAEKLVNQLIEIFNGNVLRRFDREDGKIAHSELKIDDSVLMISDSVAGYPAQKTMLHLYVSDVFKTFEKAINLGCELIEKPINKAGDADTRGFFYDCSGNYWIVSTQTHP